MRKVKVFDRSGRPAPFPYSGFGVLMSGCCPRCGGKAALLVARLPYPIPDWDPGDTPVAPLRCCGPVWPTEVEFLFDGEVRAAAPLADLLKRIPEQWHSDAFWAIIVLSDARPGPVQYPDPPPSYAAELALGAREALRGRYWPQEALQWASREGRKIRERGLWRELWEFGILTCRAVASSPEGAEAAAALYRALCRFAAGSGRVLAGLGEEGGPVFVTVASRDYKAEGVSEPSEYAWPWDVAAFTLGFWDPGRVEEAALGAVYRLDVSGGEPAPAHWRRVREARRYTLTPTGVRAALRGAGALREVFLREVGPTLVYFEAGIPGFPRGAVRGWFDWELGCGFSPWQLTCGFRPAEDPLLGLAAGLDAALVTAEARQVARGERRILPPEEGRVKLEPRVAYFGDPGERGLRSVRRPLPAAERRAPRPHAVAGHLRRVSGRASEEARRAAEEYRVVLPEGFTFVRPHVRGRKEDPR